MNRSTLILVFFGLVLVLPTSALAYMGPTLGLGVIGTAIAVVALLALSVFAFVVAPLRRAFKKKQQKSADEDSAS